MRPSFSSLIFLLLLLVVVLPLCVAATTTTTTTATNTRSNKVVRIEGRRPLSAAAMRPPARDAKGGEGMEQGRRLLGSDYTEDLISGRASGGDYYVSASLGTTNPVELMLTLDTGSSTFAVAGSTLDGTLSSYLSASSNGASPYCYPAGSSTCPTPVTNSYASGSWSGNMATTTISFGEPYTSTVTFATITTQDDFFLSSVTSGILGLAYPCLICGACPAGSSTSLSPCSNYYVDESTSQNTYGNYSTVGAAFYQNVEAYYNFGLYLCPVPAGTTGSGVGSFILGQAETAGYYFDSSTGLQWADVAMPGYYGIKITDVRVSSTPTGATTDLTYQGTPMSTWLGSNDATYDNTFSGTTNPIFDSGWAGAGNWQTEIVTAVVSYLVNNGFTGTGGDSSIFNSYCVDGLSQPLSEWPTFHFCLSPKSGSQDVCIGVDPHVYISSDGCSSGMFSFQPTSAGSNSATTLGNQVLAQYYVVFDAVGERVGFGIPAPHADNCPSSVFSVTPVISNQPSSAKTTTHLPNPSKPSHTTSSDSGDSTPIVEGRSATRVAAESWSIDLIVGVAVVACLLVASVIGVALVKRHRQRQKLNLAQQLLMA